MEALGINLGGLITQLVSFLILLAVLVRLLYRPVLRMLDERSNRIKESLEAAERAESQAVSAAERVEREIAEARTQGQALVAEARDAAARYRAEQDERARDEAEAFLERARADVGRERDAAIEQVRSEFAGLALDAAERVIGKSVDAETHRELIEEVLVEGLEERKN